MKKGIVNKKPLSPDRIQLLNWLAPVVLAVFVGLFYAGALKNDTALDDAMVLTSNTYVKAGVAGIPDILSHDSFHGATHRPASKLGWRYRPLSLVCFALLHELFGEDVQVYHLFSLLLYFACAWAMFLFLKRWWLSERPLLALIGALFFVILPVHVEVVANIKSADELLACWFSILFLDRLLQWNQGGKRLALLLACCYYLLALFSKESGVLLAVLAPMLLYVRSDRSIGRSIRDAVPFFLLTLLFIAVRLLISQVPEGKIDLTNDPYLFASLHQKIATVSVVLLEYLRLLLFPKDLVFDYGFRHIAYVTFSDPAATLSAALHIVLLGWSIRAALKRDAVGFFLLSYLLGILLLSNLVLNVGPVMADRFVFFPGFFLVTGLLLVIARTSDRFLPDKPALIAGALLLVVSPFAYLKTVARVSEWKDNLTLYRADLKKAPDSFRVVAFNAMQEIATAENSKDTIAKPARFRYGIDLMERAYSIYPDYKNMYNEWGFAYYRLGDIDSAEWAWGRLKALFPSSQYNPFNEQMIRSARYQEQMARYNAKYSQQDYAALSSILRKAIGYKADEDEAWTILGKVFYLNNQRDSAAWAWKEAVRLDSTNTEAQGYLKMK